MLFRSKSFARMAVYPLLFILTACTVYAPPVASPGASQSIPTVQATPSPVTPAPTPRILQQHQGTLIAIGDIMVHSPQLPGYYNAETKEYRFDSWFAEVAPLFADGDWVVGNLETPLAGADLKYTGYPRFNAPAQLAEALASAGVNVLSTANNHSLDRGYTGIERTLHNVRAAGIVPYGTATSEDEARAPVLVEKNNIRIGFLSYTYGTNGIPIPADKPYAVNLIDQELINQDIARVKAAGADLVAVSLHFGNEYQRLPSEGQIRTARDTIAAGADLILGSHPHVVQPYEHIVIPASESADEKERRGIVIYSLGNFISNQTGDWKDVGLIFGVRVTKAEQPDGSFVTTMDEVTTSPTWVHIDKKTSKRLYTVLPLRETLADRSHPNLTVQEYARMESMLEEISSHLLKRTVK